MRVHLVLTLATAGSPMPFCGPHTRKVLYERWQCWDARDLTTVTLLLSITNPHQRLNTNSSACRCTSGRSDKDARPCNDQP